VEALCARITDRSAARRRISRAASLVASLVVGDTSEFAPPVRAISVMGVLGTVVFAPVIETFVMALTLPILHALGRRIVVTALLSAVLWGVLHALIAPLRFVGRFWAFYVLSASYLAWRKISFWSAFAVACIPHALNNGWTFPFRPDPRIVTPCGQQLSERGEGDRRRVSHR
jgi:hypothetical protein